MAKKSGIPGIGALNTMMDSMEFVKKAWSSFNLPTNLAPTMDVDELDKRIADLRAVEQWLNVNLSMLRGTIQGLEIQRGTLAAVQAFGRAVTGSSDAMAQLAQAARVRPAAPAPSAPSASSATSPFTRSSAAADDGDEPDVEEEDDRDDDHEDDEHDDDHDDDHADDRADDRADDARDDRDDGERGRAGRQATAAAAASGAEVMRKAASSLAAGLSEMQAAAVPLQLPSGTQMVNPAAWWNLLQGQFNQVAQAALSGAGVLAGGAGAGAAKQAKDEPAGTAKAADRKPGRGGGTTTHRDKGSGKGDRGRAGGGASGGSPTRKNAGSDPTNQSMKRNRTKTPAAAGRSDTAPRKPRGPARKTSGT